MAAGKRSYRLYRASLPPTILPAPLWEGTLCTWNPARIKGLALTPCVPLPPQIVENVANNILLQIPEPIDLHLVTAKYPVLYEESMNTVLVQEVIR